MEVDKRDLDASPFDSANQPVGREPKPEYDLRDTWWLYIDSRKSRSARAASPRYLGRGEFKRPA